MVFVSCACLAIAGFVWTLKLVDDTPHESLSRAEEAYEEEAEKPGEVKALEDTVIKGIELGVVTASSDGQCKA